MLGPHHSIFVILFSQTCHNTVEPPGQNLITDPFWAPVVCFLQGVDSHGSASHSRGYSTVWAHSWSSINICWLNACVNLASQDNEGIFSSPWLDPATAKWQFFRKILDQFTLAAAAEITALSKSLLCTSGNKAFSSLTSLKAFFPYREVYISY